MMSPTNLLPSDSKLIQATEIGGALDRAWESLTDLLFEPPTIVTETRSAWKTICYTVAENGTAESDSLRKQFDRIITAGEMITDWIPRSAAFLNKCRGVDEASAAMIDSHKRELAFYREQILNKWKTQEDLEDLVAEHFPLTEKQLTDLVKKYPAPQAWYDEPTLSR